MTDMERVKKLVRELHSELKLDEPFVPPTARKVARVEHEDFNEGQQTLVISYDDNDVEIRREVIPKMGRGMESTEGPIPPG